MFLYIAVAGSMLAAASAEPEYQFHAHPSVAAAQAKKYIAAHPDTVKNAKAARADRNLRDAVKPEDIQIDLFYDSACTVASQSFVTHGNYCLHDPDVGANKIGCTTDGIGNVQVQFLGFDEVNDNDCEAQPQFDISFPFTDDNDSPIANGACVPFEGHFARVSCQKKDRIQKDVGLHILE